MADQASWMADQKRRMHPAQPLPGQTGEMSNYSPSWRDVLADAMGTVANKVSGKPYSEARKDSMTLLGMAPGTGQVMAAEDAVGSAKQGDYLGAALSALGAVPALGKEAQVAGKAGRQLLAETAAKGLGRREAITAVNLRHMPLPEAIDIAKSERHIIPAGKGGATSFVGAPHQAQTRADIERLRAAFDADVGAGSGGADWYQRAQDWIKKTAGPDPARQHELANNLALFSAQADPKTNLGFSVQARNAAIMGTPADTVRTGQQARAYNKAFETGGDVSLGQKTGVYAGHLDPTVSNPTTGTNDIWHARALGYGEPELNGGLGTQQHSWMDAETVLAVDRANKAAIGGRVDWTPGEVQAAPWVAGKGRGLEKSRNMTPEQGLAEASKTYPEYAPSFTAYGTHEMTPGSTTGHLPDIAKGGDEATADYAAKPGSWWQGEGGRDTLYDAQGAYAGPSEKTTGIYDQPNGERVINPGQAATPLVSFTGETGRRVVDKPSAQMMTGTEGFRAMMDAQDAGAWSANIPGQRMGHMNAFEVPGQRDRGQLAELMAKGAGVGQPGLIDQGPQQLITDFGDPGLSGQTVKNVQAAIPGAVPVRREGEVIDYAKQWKAGEGSDAVTSKMLSGLNPAQEAAFSKPEVRQAVLAKFDRDAEIAARTGQPVRADLQNARRIFGEGGIPALKEALGKGLLPAAAVGVFLPYLAGGSATGGSEAQ